MPGIVVEMDAGAQNGARTDHDRDAKVNGVNGEGQPGATEKGKLRADGDVEMTNGAYDSGVDADAPPMEAGPLGFAERPPRMNDLPDEIIHITQGYFPLAKLLSRLAQLTHNSLQEKVIELARMPLPPTPALNGNAAQGSNSAVDDVSPENLARKEGLLLFAQAWHTKWVKALVITDWSRKAEHVSKLIDLKSHIDQQRRIYDQSLEELIGVKRGLIWSRLPNPDLKTALQVLATGECNWMPELGYIQPPPLTPEEMLKWIRELDTLLAMRLNLEDFDKIPYQFRDYTIASGRVTFKVEGEFEVDLTIADEDFEKQFWFIDFRFTFSPASNSLSGGLRAFLESRVNDELAKDGLHGCYRFLHEFVLTHKINELKRQAIELNRNTWTNTLAVEPLNRALAIQYWVGRYGPKAPKSWILIGVKSNRRPNAPNDPKTTSSLSVSWHRDGKEMRDVDIPIDVVELSAEMLLKTVIARHVEYIFRTIRDKLAPAPRFVKRESSMTLCISKKEPIDSSLSLLFGVNEMVKLVIEPITGFFAVTPHSKYAIMGENRLNSGNVDPAEDGVLCLETMRRNYLREEFNRQGTPMGWHIISNPLPPDDVKKMLQTRETPSTFCLQRQGWDPRWYVMVSLSLNGDEWWLFGLKPESSPLNPQLEYQLKLPFNMGQPLLSEDFWDKLTIFITGLISRATNARYLNERRVRFQEVTGRSFKASDIRLPAIAFRLSDLLPSLKGRTLSAGQRKPTPADGRGAQGDAARESHGNQWVYDTVEVHYRGLQMIPSSPDDEGHVTNKFVCVETINLRVVDKQKFSLLKGPIDENVIYKPGSGEFQFLIRHEVAEPVAEAIEVRVKAIDRLVDFLAAMGKNQEASPGSVRCESVTLRKVVCTYGGDFKAESEATSEAQSRKWKIELDLAQKHILIRLEKDNPHIRMVDLLERLINEPGRLRDLTRWLPFTLSLMTAFDEMEDRWAVISANGQGHVIINAHDLDNMSIKYVLPGANAQAASRCVVLSGRLRFKASEPWWLIRREHEWLAGDKVTGQQPDTAEDEFTPVLQSVWDTHDNVWRGLATGAAAQPYGDIATLLLKLDEGIAAVAEKPSPEPKLIDAPAASVAAPKQGAGAPKLGASNANNPFANRQGQGQPGGFRGRPMAV